MSNDKKPAKRLLFIPMATKGIVPVRLSLTEGDFYTLYAPEFKEHGAQWQAFLGSGDDLYVFDSPAELLLFLESGAAHDLSDHPKWSSFAHLGADRVVPQERDHYDLVGVPALLAEKPTYAAVSGVSRSFRIARALGNVLGSTDVQVFFSSHSILHNVDRGVDHFSGPSGLGEWTAIGRVVLSNWNNVIDALDAAITRKTAADFQDNPDIAGAEAAITKAQEESKERAETTEPSSQVDPYDESPWAQAGIDPIKIQIDGRTLYTLRTYLKAQPVFLGKYGEIFTFNSSKSLIRWLLEHDDHDLAAVATWSELVDQAQGGDLDVMVHPDNVYSFNGIVRDINQGPEQVDTAQMTRAYELLADAADWAADDSLNSFFLANPRMQDYISYLLGPSRTAGYTPTPPFDKHAQDWKQLEEMLIKRFSRF